MRIRKILKKVYKNKMVKINELESMSSFTDSTAKFVETRLSVFIDLLVDNFVQLEDEKRVT
jgi:hypothetical protein